MAEKAKSSLFAQLGPQAALAQKAHEAHKSDDTDYGIVNLPAGIKGGIAKLKTATWALYKEGTTYAGKPYIMFRGIAHTPDSWAGCPVKGQGVVVTLPLFAQPEKKSEKRPNGVSFEENWAEMLNHLRLFGIDTAKTTANQIDAILAFLEKEALDPKKMFFTYSTRGWTPAPSAKEPNPKELVFTSIHGLTSHETEKHPALAAVETSLGEAAPFTANDADPIDPVPGEVPEPTADADGGAEAPPADVATGEAPQEDDIPGLVLLAETADDASAEDLEARGVARDRLRELALEAGKTDEEVDDAPDWSAVAEMLLPAEEPAPEPEPEPEPWVPAKGNVVLYKPIDPKTGKPFLKPKSKEERAAIKCEITGLDKKSSVATLLSLVDKKTTYAKVPWASLTPA